MNQSSSRSKSPIKQWLPAVAAAALLGTVVFAGVAMGGDDGGTGESATGDVETSVPTIAPLTVPDSVPDVVATVETTAPVEKSQLSRTLSKGMVGDDVREVQERLAELGFGVGPVDGVYGDLTRQGVWAFEKLVLEVESTDPDGQITPEMWDEMQEPFRIQPRRPNATRNHTEVYLPEQVLAIFHDDVPVMISHISSGSGDEWCEEVTISPGEYGNREGEDPLVRGECGISNTPGGVFHAYREVEGVRQSALGGMLNPVYFNYGIAIHGAYNVPLQPASHGCIRIDNSLSEDMQELISMGDQIYVWDGEKEPEENGAPPPTFNWLDPEWASTTTTTTIAPETTTTEVAPDTTAPATTSPPATAPPTTAPPVATTTTTTTTEPTGGTDTGGTDGGSADGGGADGGSGGADTGADSTTGS